MSRIAELGAVLLSATVLVIAVGKLVANQQEIAELPPAVLRAIETEFPHSWKSTVETIQDDGTYLVTLRLHGSAYRVQVRTSAEIANVSPLDASSLAAP